MAGQRAAGAPGLIDAVTPAFMRTRPGRSFKP